MQANMLYLLTLVVS